MMLSDDWVPGGTYPAGEADRIQCAFLRMVRPNTSSMSAFIRDLGLHGLDPRLAAGVGINVLQQQHPALYPTMRDAQASGRAPDIYNLDRAGVVSHADRYMPFFPEVAARVRELVKGGRISYRDTVGLKFLVADRSGTCSISDASKLETRILFIRAGGDLESGLIGADDWLRLVQGLTPVLPGFTVSAGSLGWVNQASVLRVVALESNGDPWRRPHRRCGEVLSMKVASTPSD